MTGKPWFRLYSDMPDNPKIGMLDDAAHRCWIECLCFAAQQGESGRVGTLKEINWKCRRDYTEQLQTLVECDALRVTCDVYYVSQWRHRQYESDSSRERTQKYRERKKVEKTAPVVTSQERHTDRHSDAPRTEQSRADTEIDSVTDVTGVPPPAVPPIDFKKIIFNEGLVYLSAATGKPKESLRSLVGKWISRGGEANVAAAIIAAQKESAIEPIGFIEKTLGKPNGKPKLQHTGFADTDYAGSAKDSGFVVV